MRARLSAKAINSLEPGDKSYKVWDTELKGFFLRISPKGTKTYCVFYRTDRRANEFTLGRHGQLTPTTARQLAISKLGEVAQGVDIQLAKQEKANQQEQEKISKLGSFVDGEFGPWVLSQNRSGHESLRVINKEFGHLLSLPMHSITPRHIYKWIAEVRMRGLKPSTINRNLAIIKRVLNVAVDWGYLRYSPIAKVKKLKVDELHRVRFLSDTEELSLRQALDARERDMRLQRARYNEWLKTRHFAPYPSLIDQEYVDHLKPLVILAMNTGLRRGELFSLQARDIDLCRGVLTVRGDNSKNGRSRHVGINKEAKETLLRWGIPEDSEALVFPNNKTNQRFNNITKSWNGVLARAKLTDFRFHDLRHHFASKLAMRGVDLLAIKELLGHSTLDMTLRYAHLAPEHKIRSVDALDPSF